MKPTRSFDLEQQVQKVDLLYQQSLTAPLVGLTMTVIFLFFGWHVVNTTFLIAWTLVLNLTSITRICVSFFWRKQKNFITSTAQLQKWSWFLISAVGIVGIALGLMGAVSVQQMDGVKAICISMLILGVVSASVSVYSPSYLCAMAMLVPSTLIWAASAASMGQFDYDVMAGLVFIFFLIQLRLAKNWSGYTNNFLRLNLELHDKEERLRQSRDASGAVDWEWNLNNDSFHFEGNLQPLFGQTPLGKRSFDYLKLVHPEDLDRVEKAMIDSLRSGILDLEHRVLLPNQKIQFIAIKGQAKFDESKKPISLRGICWDVTNKKADEQLRYERDLFAAADKAKLMFLANASHEIRTPLAAIKGFAELSLERSDLSPDLREEISTILRNGKYLTAIVNDLLDLSKSEADRLYIQKSNMLPLNEINDSLMVIRGTAKQKGLDLKVIYESAIPETIFCDPIRFRQILINLLTNAVKYTNEGEVTLQISYADQVLRLLVTDTGIGISSETRERLFQPFARGLSTEVQKQSGSGLGLALSRSLAKKMGGDLKLLFSEPLGTRFRSCFELTLQTGSVVNTKFISGDQAQKPVTTPTTGASPGLRLSGLSILLVEDQADLRHLMKLYLQKYGARIETCNHGGEAVEKAFKDSYDYILMDIQMPVMDGYEATRQLRARGYRKPIVALTAHASTDDRLKCADVGCDFYLSKPVNMSYLLDVLTQQVPKTEITPPSPSI